ncbi:MAG: DNA internalization-related competence protein ComEC/Rec2 [Pseudomonadota bacterium]
MLFTQTLAQLPAASTLALVVLPVLIPWRGQTLYAACVLGVLFTILRAQPLLDARWPAERNGEDVWIEGRIASLPEVSDKATRFLFEPLAENLPQKIRASWYRDAEVLRGGDCWRMQLRMRTPHGSLNPGGFDYEGWLFRQGIGATASVRKAERCKAADGYPILRLRQHISDRLHGWIPDEADAQGRAMLAALTIGDTSGFTDTDWDAFRLTGTTHLVAISGFNIAIVAGIAFFLLRWLWVLWPRLCLWIPAQRVALLGSAVFAFAYALLAGFEPPVQRAVVMLFVVLAAAWMHRLAKASRVLALAWLAVLLLDPFATLSAGTWLSFGAVAAIFYVSVGRYRAPGFWRAALRVQIMLSVMLAPLSLFFFHGVSWFAPLINLAVVPLFALLTPLAVGSLIFSLIFPPPASMPLQALGVVLQQVGDTLLGSLEYPQLWFAASPSPIAGGLFLLAAVLLFAPRGLPLKFLALLCLLPLLWPKNLAPESGFELTALDVGQGLAVVVRTQNHALLYDAGPAFEDGFDAGESVVAPYLLSRGVSHLDLLLLSHGDNDHAGGVASVRRLLKVEREIGTPDHEACREGQPWEWDGVRFELLHPDDSEWSDNNSSCVLKIEVSGFSALLAGDIEKKAERRLLEEKPESLKADVLIAPHHGSKTSSTEEFVAAVRPKVVIYGAGWRNHFKHPRSEVVERYNEVGAKQYITGNLGALTVRPDLSVEEYRSEAVRFWNAPVDYQK